MNDTLFLRWKIDLKKLFITRIYTMCTTCAVPKTTLSPKTYALSGKNFI